MADTHADNHRPPASGEPQLGGAAPPKSTEETPPAHSQAAQSQAAQSQAAQSQAVVDAATRKRPWSQIAQRAAAVGMAASVVLHALLLITFAFLVSGGGGPGGSSVNGTALPVDVALMSEAELQSLADGPASVQAPGVTELPAGEVTVPTIDVPGGSGTPDLGELGGTAGTGLGGSGAGTGTGVGPGAGGSGGGGGTSFFNVAARGNRFAYIVDVSGSMDGEKLQYLKTELRRSIDRLPDDAQFVVVPFETEARPLATPVKYINATSRSKREVIAQIDALRADGGTQPLPAFNLVLRMQPRPDAVFFMTDGLFDREIPSLVRSLNLAGRRVPIHCIALVDNSSEALMKRIANDSDGSYTFVGGVPGGRP